MFGGLKKKERKGKRKENNRIENIKNDKNNKNFIKKYLCVFLGIDKLFESFPIRFC